MDELRSKSLLPMALDDSQPSNRRPWLVRHRRILLIASALLTLLTLSAAFGRSSAVTAALHLDGTSGLAPVYNRTLGFQKVFALGLPGRTDRRDALTVAASFSKIDLEWSDGVMFEDIPPKAIPEIFTKLGTGPSMIASWRAHLNVLSRIVAENIQTALIIEDDSDWDVTLKGQLEQFAKGVTELQGEAPGDAPRRSAYGNKWDMLWIGHCRSAPSMKRQKVYTIANDTTVPPVPFRRTVWRRPRIPSEVLSNDTRLIFRSDTGGCTYGYAMSWEGARKVLVSLSLHATEGVIYDIAMSRMCKQMHTSPYNCYSIYPPLISTHRFAGTADRDSDIRLNNAAHRHGESTQDVVYSVIQNAERLLTGAKEVLSQWPNDTVPTRNVNQRYSDEVSGNTRMMDLKSLPEQIIPGVNAAGE